MHAPIRRGRTVVPTSQRDYSHAIALGGSMPSRGGSNVRAQQGARPQTGKTPDLSSGLTAHDTRGAVMLLLPRLSWSKDHPSPTPMLPTIWRTRLLLGRGAV